MNHPDFLLHTIGRHESVDCGPLQGTNVIELHFASVNGEKKRTMVGDFSLTFHGGCHPEYAEVAETFEVGKRYRLVAVDE